MSITFSSADRLLILAPHPDDEAIACGGLLRAALRGGAALRVVFATDGDNNPWPQRLSERRWSLDAESRVRWGRLRRAETAAAARALGQTADAQAHLGWPDGGLTALLTPEHSGVAVAALRAELQAFAPTRVVFPALMDRHPDHSALAIMAALVLESTPDIRSTMYLVHRGIHGDWLPSAEWSLPLVAEDVAHKREALLGYRSQLHFGRWRLLNHATEAEAFLESECRIPDAERTDGRWRWRFTPGTWLRTHTARSLRILALEAGGVLMQQRMSLSDPRLRVTRTRGRIEVEMQPLIGGSRQVLAKLERDVPVLIYDITPWQPLEDAVA